MTVTPAIWTIVASRWTQSSGSNADENREKRIHAHSTAYMENGNAEIAAATCPSATRCAK
jgi:hypothetical protein